MRSIILTIIGLAIIVLSIVFSKELHRLSMFSSLGGGVLAGLNLQEAIRTIQGY